MESTFGEHAITYYKENCSICGKKVANCRVFYSPLLIKMANGGFLTSQEKNELVNLPPSVQLCVWCFERDPKEFRGYVEAKFEIGK